MDIKYLGGVIALVKILALVVVFVMIIYSTAIETDPKRKLIEIVTSIGIASMIFAMQTILPAVLGSGVPKSVIAILTSWDPSTLTNSK